MNAGKILVVEDNPITRKMFRVALRTSGYEVLEASDGATALELMTRENPDLVLQDLKLPDIDGVVLADRLRSVSRGANVPIIAISGNVERMERAREDKIGFSEFLTKPVEASHLLAVVRTFLTGQKVESEKPGRGKRALIVDDAESQRKLLRILLENLGFEVETAVDGVEGLQKARRSPPDAVVSDILMPRIDGFHLCQALREDRRFVKVPVILVSSVYTNDDDRAMALAIGASALVVRSGGGQELADSLRHHLLGGAAPAASVVNDSALKPGPQEMLLYQMERLVETNARQSQRLALFESGYGLLSQLHEVLRTGVSPADLLAELLPRFLDAAGLSLGATYLRDAGGRPALEGWFGFPDATAEVLLNTPELMERVEDVVTRGEPLQLARGESEGELGCLLDRLQITCLLLTPLKSGAECLGVILIASESLELKPDWLSIAGALGSQIGQIAGLARAMTRADAAETRYQSLMDEANDGVALLDTQGRILEANPRMEELFGRPKADLIGTNYAAYLSAAGRDRGMTEFGRLLKEKKIVAEAIEMVQANGTAILIDFSAAVVGRDDGYVLATARDATVRHRTERRQEVQYEVTRLLSEDGSEEETIRRILQVLGERLGWRAGGFWSPVGGAPALRCRACWTAPGPGMMEFEDASRATVLEPGRELAGRVWSGGGFTWVADIQKDPDFSRTLFARRADLHGALAFPLVHQGRALGVLELFDSNARALDSDLSAFLSTLGQEIGQFLQRRTAERERDLAWARLDQLVTSSPVMLYSCAPGGDFAIRYMSPNVLLQLGYESLDFLQDAALWTTGLHPDDRSRVLSELEQGLAEKGSFTLEYRFRHKDGTWRWMRDEGRLLRNSKGEPIEIVGYWADNSDQKALEEQLRQAQKMEAVGRLAGGVAHDFNNLLTVINGYSQQAVEKIPFDDPLHGDLVEVNKAGHRAASLTRQLLAFSRRQILVPRVLDLNAIVKDMEKMVRRLIGEDVELTAVLDPALGSIKADAGQIEQVVMNLVLNARDAMPAGGELKLRTSNVELDETDSEVHRSVRPCPHVLLEISDTGTGMDASVREHLFEPFFTTKEQGHGTGLGLSTVYGIVKQSGGHIRVYSEPGRGTTFKVCFPRIDDRPVAATVLPPSPCERTDSATILLIEDEASVRVLAKTILSNAGYRVLEASNGEEAVRVASEGTQTIDLVLSDIVMPRQGGPETLRKLRSTRPALRAIFMTGYSETMVAHESLVYEGAMILEKPFTAVNLLEKVRRMLESEAVTE